ncbi:MAG: SUMF1/EgtB/PvdO family nonheme iron enzyme [Saprospiraceae bacterium]
MGRDAALRDPTKLKPLLAPVFARSAEDQKRFYELFDRYVADIKKEDYVPVEPGFWQKLRAVFRTKWMRWFLLATLAAAAGYTILLMYLPKKERSFPLIRFDSNLNQYTAGDTVRLINTTKFLKQDSSEFVFSWHLERQNLLDSTAIPETEQDGGDRFNSTFVAPVPEFGIRHDIVLTVRFKDGRPAVSPKTGRDIFESTLYSELRLSCKNRPTLPRLSLPAAKIPVAQNATFAIAERPKPGYRYRWQVIGDTLADQPTLRHFFDRPGTFEVWLVVTDTTQPGLCSADTTFTLRVGDEQVNLPYQPLQYDRTPPALVFAWAAYLLLALLAAAAAWYWWRWSRRKPPPPAAAQPEKETRVAVSVATESGDAPPYYIPFRQQKGTIPTARQQYRLGDALRLRQQTDDLVLDLPATLRATLDRGGYPTLRFRYLTRPAEYLFLVDEQMPGHHLARLFRHLAETLSGQDVVLDLVWCDPDLRRFRGEGLPKGTTLDGLRRHFPQHRLVLLGLGHALLDTANDASRLRPDAKSALNAWPQRLLLTPRTAADWDWRETALYRQFGLYPADLRGMQDAATFVESGLDTSDMPADFHAWKALQCDLRLTDPRTEYRPWRTLADHEEYLKPYGPALRDWFLALAVHPTPTWEVTLAVARALDIAPTHDRLLALARIPALRDGHLHPGLRRTMLQALGTDTEERARRAVLTELEEIRHLTIGSHVADETKVYIAVQAYLLNPHDAGTRADLTALLDAGLISRPLEAELDVFVEKLLARPPETLDPDLINSMSGRPAKIRNWLDVIAPPPPAPAEPPPPSKKPFFTPDFWRAAALTGLLVLLAVLGWQACRPGSPVQTALVSEHFRPGRDTLRHFVFLKEHAPADSAMIFNNLGALAGELLPRSGQLPPTDSLKAAVFNLRKNRTSLNDYNAAVRGLYAWLDTAAAALPGIASLEAFDATDAFFEKARNLKPDYTLAAQNAVRNRYNYGAALLDRYRSQPDSLLLTADLFAAAGMLADEDLPALAPDARHGRGVALYYAGQRDSARVVYDSLRAARYFDTLTLRPNLENLLGFGSNCYRVVNVAKYIALRNRELTQPQLDAIAADPNSRLARETWAGAVPLGQTVELIDTVDLFLKVLYKGKISYLAKYWANKPTLEPCSKTPALPPAAAPPKNDLRTILTRIEKNMVPLAGGTFRMGCTDEQGEDCFDNEKPAHDVILTDFAIGRTEVTVAQYMAFVDDTKTHYPEWLEPGSEYHIKTGKEDLYKRLGAALQNPDNPIVGISWDDAVAYCTWLTQKTGKRYRLPTEAEWEYAARGGQKATNQTKYAGSDNLDEVAWYGSNSGSKTHPVGVKKPNALGLYDMSGNVFEWCADWYGEYEDTGKPQENPGGPVKASYRVYRGGGWHTAARLCRAAFRVSGAPAGRGLNPGFRLVLQL